MRALLFLIILLTSSCTKYSVLSRDAMGLHINAIDMKILRVDEVTWLVGKRREHKISQSFTFMVDTPKLSTKDLDYLTEQKGINAWIMRLVVQRGSDTQDLGSIYIPFRSKAKSRGHSGRQASSVFLKVYYAAAYASERFRMFHCPAFDHNRRIQSLKIAGEEKLINITLGPISHYREKAQHLELTPNAFNGGNSLEGDYFVEFAPYDYEKKMIHSSFIRIPQYVEVRSEEKISIPSCRGESPELTPPDR